MNEWAAVKRDIEREKEKKKRKEKKKLSAHSPYAVGTTHGVISWYCGRDKRKRIVYTHERWTIISTIVKLADDALLRRKTRDRGLHASRFLHFLWYFTLTIVSPWTNRSWVLEYLIKGTDSPFPSEFEFSFFSDTRKERIKYLTWARANRENRVCDLERTNVVMLFHSANSIRNVEK